MSYSYVLDPTVTMEWAPNEPDTNLNREDIFREYIVQFPKYSKYESQRFEPAELRMIDTPQMSTVMIEECHDESLEFSVEYRTAQTPERGAAEGEDFTSLYIKHGMTKIEIEHLRAMKNKTEDQEKAMRKKQRELWLLGGKMNAKIDKDLLEKVFDLYEYIDAVPQHYHQYFFYLKKQERD